MIEAKIRTTAVLLGAAGAVVAGAMFLERSPAKDEVATAPAVAGASCGKAAPSTATAKLEHGTFAGNLSAGKLVRGAGGEVHAAFELTTDQVTDVQRPPLDLAFVIDHSGSMSDGRLDHAKEAARGIVDRLNAQDHVALIQYDDTAQVVVASIAMDGEGKAKLRHALDGMMPGGGTNLNAGLVLGREEVQRAHLAGQMSRMILLSDGRANEGITDPAQIADGARDAANHGIRIASVGIGLDFNEDLMEAIAEAGRGNYHYVKEAHDLEKVIAGELAAAQATVATSVELRLQPACGGVTITAVHGYGSHGDRGVVSIPMADLFGGDSRKVLVSMKVPDAVAGTIGALHATLVYRDAKGGAVQTREMDLGVEVSTDATAATASVDQNVMAQVLQIDAAESMRKAAQAYERGDRDGAVKILDQSAHEINQKGAHYKIAPAKTAATVQGLDEMSKSAKAYSPGSYESKDMLKSSKQKARVMSKKGSF